MVGSLFLLWCVTLLSILQIVELCSDDNFPTVTISQGILKGRKVNSTNGAPYCSFQGIPYAKPPVGPLRFKAPVASEPWNGTLEALQEQEACLQPDVFPLTVNKSEDCLYINIYTPQLVNPESPLPVMVWIHGGGFIAGSGNIRGQNPELLLSNGVVFVSLNYRLGVFGFLCTEDSASLGNFGMKDQVLALKWVQQNIAAFGGNPRQVTVFGESAGGASVHYHMLSPMSKGLFRAAISQSGAVGNGWALAQKPRERAFELGKALGFSGNSSLELVDFLRNINSTQLNTAAPGIVLEWEKYRMMKTFFVPYVETPVEGEASFLPEDPIRLLKQGKFHKVPYITGITSAEGKIALGLLGVLDNPAKWPEMDSNFLNIFKPELRFCKYESCGDNMITRIKSFYFGNQSVSNHTVNTFLQLCSDIYFKEAVVDGARTMSSASTLPVYLYEFTYNGGIGYTKSLFPKSDELPGVSHADDLGYIFGLAIPTPSVNQTDIKVRSRFVTMWTNFAKTLNPTPESSDEYPEWLPYTNSSSSYLDIGSELIVKTNMNQERMDFWRELYNPASEYERL